VRHTMADVPHVLTISWVISQAAATILNFSIQNLWVFRAANADGKQAEPRNTEETERTH
jgi:putative membrane protein